MVEETGAQNAAFLKSIALEGAKIADHTEELAELAKAKLSAPHSGPGVRLSMGPLMSAIEAAAIAFRKGWEERRDPGLEAELGAHDTSLHDWMEYMTELLLSVNDAADIAMTSENMEIHYRIGAKFMDMLAAHASPIVDANAA
jgi:hypothetical protein